jgi:hypothetical protein
MRDARGDTPGAANNVLRLLKIVLNFAVEEELIEVNPAARIKELKGGEYRSWTDDECATFEKRWDASTMQRRAYALALNTGQRKAEGGSGRHDQGAPQGRLHPSVAGQDRHGSLDCGAQCARRRAVAWRSEPYEPANHVEGKAFDPVYYGAWFADAIYEAGLPDDCVLHGLRKCAARKLAEAGCSERDQERHGPPHERDGRALRQRCEQEAAVQRGDFEARERPRNVECQTR